MEQVFYAAYRIIGIIGGIAVLVVLLAPWVEVYYAKVQAIKVNPPEF